MAGWYIAKEAIAIGDQIDFMNEVEDSDLPIYYEDILARVAFLGFNFRDVVQAGLYRLGRVSAHTVTMEELCPDYPTTVVTDDWKEQVRSVLALYPDRLCWTSRTFLQKMLVQGNITARELSKVDGIVTGVIEGLRGRDPIGDERESPFPDPAPLGDQLDLDI